jgi:hypothetical protein
MPITSAATSMSRTAIHERPALPRAMFLAASASTATIDSTSRYLAAASVNGVAQDDDLLRGDHAEVE